MTVQEREQLVAMLALVMEEREGEARERAQTALKDHLARLIASRLPVSSIQVEISCTDTDVTVKIQNATAPIARCGGCGQVGWCAAWCTHLAS